MITVWLPDQAPCIGHTYASNFHLRIEKYDIVIAMFILENTIVWFKKLAKLWFDFKNK